MGFRRITHLFTHMGLLSKESFDHIIYRKIALLISVFWVYFTNSLVFLIKFIARHVFRIKLEDSSQKTLKDCSNRLEPNDFEERCFHVLGEEEEEEPSNFSFKFEYQIPMVNTIRNEQHSIPAIEENLSAKTANISNYRFLSEKNFSGFVEEPEVVTFRVHQSFVSHSEEKTESNFLSSNDFEKTPKKSNDVLLLKSQNLEEEKFLDFETKSLGEIELIGFNSKSLGEKEVIQSFSGFDSDSDSLSLSDGYSVKNLVVDSDTDGILSERDFNDKESLMNSSTFEVELMGDMEKIEEDRCSDFTGGFSDINNQTICGNISDGFLSERGFDAPEKNSDENFDELQSFAAENYSPYTDKHSQLDDIWSENDSLEPELELKELNPGEAKGTQLPSSSSAQIELKDSSDDELSYIGTNRNNFESLNLADPEPMAKDLDLGTEFNSCSGNHSSPVNGSEQAEENLERDSEGDEKRTAEEDTKRSEETQLKDLDSEELDELESLWEHQDLIEQLKMELKRARAIGLPTIFEESESPKTIEDLKPWKIDEKFLREDPMDELHKFYKSYRERMRKFDIMNYQKMYAIGFLQLKNPLESLGVQKPLIPTIVSHLSQNLRSLYRRKSSSDPSEKFIKELQIELETVYVGQTCLSWEFLRWQYEKARELPDSDPFRGHQYNQVAGEFQQFQVMVQRFIENEPFQGPRLPNYVKSRCVLCNLLQVPVVKEDCLRDKLEEKRKGNDSITSEMLEDIMEESIRVFWEFAKADKDETSVILKGLIGNQVELHDPSDFKLMADIQASLQKKDKKLKDILKTGNCLVKKFKKPREDRSNQDLFFSQVDMKLVSRVLKMARITTDQLVWCHKKLSKITFADRKIHREPSFLLFPC